MKSDAVDVASYIEEAPEERRAALKKLRALYRKTHKGAVEMIDYGMPCYKRDGEMVGAFASQKQNISIYGFGAVMAKYKPQLKGAGLGKGCIRFPKVEKIDFKLVETMLAEAATLKPVHGC